MISYYKTAGNGIEQIDHYEVGCWVNAIEPDKDDIFTLKERFHVEPEYILDSLGYAPAQKIEADVSTDINITIGE